MHRSGTSALTRLFGLMGADLPKNLMGGGASNETGHWESLDLFNLHEAMLSSVGSSWQDWRSFDSDWFQSDAAKSYKTRALEILSSDFPNSRLFVIKDPRICRFVPFWLNVLNEFRALPVAVLPIRNPMEVAASLKDRNGISNEASFLLWLRHVLDAEKDSREIPRAITAFETMLSDWPRLVGTVSTASGLQWPRRVTAATPDVEEFLTPRLRHYVVPHTRLADNPQISRWIKESYGLMLTLAKNPGHERTLQRLDRIRAEFDDASAMFGPVFTAEAHPGLKTELSRIQSDLAGATQTSQELTANLARAKEDFRAEQARADELRRQHQEDVARLNRDLDAARSFLRDSQSDVQRMSGDLSVAKTEEVKTAAENAALKTKLSNAAVALAQRDGEIKFVRSELEAARGELASFKATFSAEQDFLAKERHRLGGELNSMLAALMAERDAAMAERDAATEAKRRLADVSDELAAAQKRIARDGELIVSLKREAEEGRALETAKNARAIEAEREQFKRALEGAREDHERTRRTLVAETARVRVLEQAREDREHTRQALVAETAQIRVALEGQLKELMQRAEQAANRKSWMRSSFDRIFEVINAPRRAAALQKTVALIADSILFDKAYYLQQNPDIAKAGVDPVRHYVEFGAREHRKPHPLFDTGYYLQMYPDVAAAEDNPLAHYIRDGAYEARHPHPLFNTDWYLSQYPKVAETKLSPLVHYLTQGAGEGCNPNPLFDSAWYTERNPDVVQNKLNPLVHYLTIGAAAGRQPHPLFDVRWYCDQHPGLGSNGVSPLEHYFLQKNAAKQLPAAAGL